MVSNFYSLCRAHILHSPSLLWSQWSWRSDPSPSSSDVTSKQAVNCAPISGDSSLSTATIGVPGTRVMICAVNIWPPELDRANCQYEFPLLPSCKTRTSLWTSGLHKIFHTLFPSYSLLHSFSDSKAILRRNREVCIPDPYWNIPFTCAVILFYVSHDAHLIFLVIYQLVLL